MTKSATSVIIVLSVMAEVIWLAVILTYKIGAF